MDTAARAENTPYRGGEIELLADADRPGGWLLLIDRIRQSYVDLDDPTYLDFEYVQAFADVVDLLPDGPIAATHVGGGAATLARYIEATRPGSTQIVLEPDTAVTETVRLRLPFPKRARIRIRPVGGREGLLALRAASADLLVIDAYHGGRVPGDLTTAECLAEIGRVLRPDGVLLANLADGPPLTYTRRVAATVRAVLPDVAIRADPAVFRRRRFGNLVMAATRSGLPADGITRAAVGAPFPQRVLSGADVAQFAGSARRLTDAYPVRSPTPPDELWRVQ